MERGKVVVTATSVFCTPTITVYLDFWNRNVFHVNTGFKTHHTLRIPMPTLGKEKKENHPNKKPQSHHTSTHLTTTETLYASQSYPTALPRMMFFKMACYKVNQRTKEKANTVEPRGAYLWTLAISLGIMLSVKWE